MCASDGFECFGIVCVGVVDFNVLLLFVSGFGFLSVVFILLFFVILLYFYCFAFLFACLWVYSGVLLFRAILLYSTMYGLYCDWREWFVSVCLHVRS